MLMAWFKKSLIKHIISLDFHDKVIQLKLKSMMQFYEKIIEAKEKDVKIQPSEKWNYFESTALQNLLSKHYCLPLWQMAKKVVMKNPKMRIFTVSSGICV